MARRTSLALMLGLLATLTVAVGAQAPERPDHRAIEYPPPPDFTPPVPTRHELQNGMVVHILEDHEFPLVSVSLRFHVGAIYDPPDQLSLAEITGELMRLGGIEGMAPEELDQALEDMASSVETNVDIAMGVASASTLTENLERTMELLAGVVRHPTFAEDKLDLILNQYRSSIRNRNDDAGAVARREFSLLMYGRDYPYVAVTELEHLDHITLEAIRAFHQQYFVPGNCHVGIVGDVSEAQALALLERCFGDWEPRPLELAKMPPPGFPEQGSVNFIDFSEKAVTQSVVMVGHQGVQRDNPDYPAILMMNYILGGGTMGTSRLNREVRTKRGLAYVVYSSFSAPFSHPGTFQAFCETKGASTVEAIQTIIAEIERIRAEPVSEEELEQARREILASEVFAYAEPSNILNRAISLEFFGYPGDLLEQTMNSLRAVTAADVQAAAQQYLHPEQLTILTVGDEGRFVEKDAAGNVVAGAPLAALGRGEVHPIDITIPVPETRTETIDFSDPAARQRGLELARLVVAARGGEERIRNTKTRRAELTIRMPHPRNPAIVMEGTATEDVLVPDSVRLEMVIQGMAMLQVTSGGTGWIKQGPAVMTMPPPLAENLARSAEDLNNPPWVQALAGDLEIAAGGTVQEDGVEAIMVGIKEPSAPTIYHVDPTTGYILRRIRTAEGSRSETIMRGHKEFDGRWIPTETQQLNDGMPGLSSKVKNIEFDVEIDPLIFQRPE